MAVTNAGYLYQVGLKKVLMMAYTEELETLKACFNIQTSKRAYEEWLGVVYPGAAEEKAKGSDMVYKDIFVETPIRITMTTVASGIRVAMEDIQDEQYGALSNLSKAVGRSHKVFREVYRANIFNGAFSTTFRTGYDGLALCSTSHPLQGSAQAFAASTSTPTIPLARTATTWSNRLSPDADLDYSSIIDAITLLRRTPSREGDYAMLTPSYLLVPPELEHTAYEVTKSTERPDTANNAVSSLNRWGLSIRMSPYLLDTDSWFLVANRHDLQWFDRMPLEVKSRDAEGNWDHVIESVQRVGVGVGDPRGVTGSSGA